jgi:hypothetical protein
MVDRFLLFLPTLVASFASVFVSSGASASVTGAFASSLSFDFALFFGFYSPSPSSYF